MIPRAQGKGRKTAHKVGDDVVKIEISTVGQEALQEFGADAAGQCADREGHIHSPPPVRVYYPIEDDGEKEEGEAMEGLVVDVG